MKELKQEALRWFIQSEDDLEFVRWLSGGTEEDIRNALDDTKKVVNFCRKFLQKKGVFIHDEKL